MVILAVSFFVVTTNDCDDELYPTTPENEALVGVTNIVGTVAASTK
jgi:hypothetical protein